MEMPAAATATPDFRACRRVNAISFPPKELRRPLRTLMADYNLGLTHGKAGLPTAGLRAGRKWAEARERDQRFALRSHATAGCVASLCFIMRWLAVRSKSSTNTMKRGFW